MSGVVPRSICGPSSHTNKGAIDCCSCGLLAYGTGQIVAVIDTRSGYQIQTLHRHTAHVTQVKWPQHCSNDADILLATADSTGLIVIWNVAKGSPIHLFKDGLRTVLGLHWIADYSADSYCLLVMQQPSSFVMLDVESGKQLWKKTYNSDNFTGGDLDSYDQSRAAVLSNGGVVLMEDISISKPPATSRRFVVSIPKSQNSPANEGLKTRERFRKLVKEFVAGEVSPSRIDDVVECVQVRFHLAVRDLLLLLYPKECLLMDLVLGQTIGIISLDRNASPFSMVAPARQRDAFYFFHESGSISARFLRGNDFLENAAARRSGSSETIWNSQLSLSESGHDLIYDQKCQTDLVRATSSNKFLGGAINGLTERHLYVYTLDGKVYQVELRRISSKTDSNEILSDLLPPLWNRKLGNLKFRHRLLMTSIFSGLTSSCSVIRMSPVPPMRGVQRCYHLAVGSTNGSVFLIDLATGAVEKEISVHSSCVKGIEWTSNSALLSFSHSNPAGSGGLVKNEIIHTDFVTGEQIELKREAELEQPVIMLRVSPLKQVLIVVLKDSPLELWDLVTLTLLRIMPKKFPPVIALEWQHNTKLHRQQSFDESDAFNSATVSAPIRVSVKEKIAFADGEMSKMYVMSIEGSVLSEGKTIPSKGIVGKASSLAWKNDILVVGDQDGNVIIWDTKNGIYKRLDVQKSTVRKLAFGNGKSASKLLILTGDGLEIWELKEDVLVAQLRWPTKDSVRVLDADWSTSATVAMACSDGVVRVMDANLKHSSSPLCDYKIWGHIQCVSSLPCLLRDFFRRYLIFRAELDADLTAISSLDEGQITILQNSWNRLDPKTRSLLSDPKTSLARRAYEVSKIFGAIQDLDLWTLALHYSGDGPELDMHLDFLATETLYRRHCIEKASVYDGKRSTYEQTRRIARDLLLRGEKSKAAGLLLDASPSEKSFYPDHLLACLISASQEPSGEHFSSTIKLVATSLMTAGQLWEGIELLALAGRTSDACKYLQSYGKWVESARVARCSLDETSLSDVTKKWAEHLLQSREKVKSLQVLVSVRDWTRAIEHALMSQDSVTAACLASLCKDIPETLRNSLVHSLKSDLLKSGFQLPDKFSVAIP